MRRSGRAALAAILLFSALTLATASPAAAVPPLDLGTGYVADHSDVLSDAEEARLEEQLAALAAKDDRPELFVVLVDRFDDPQNALQWADETATQNNLAPDQYLLAIATEGRTLAISAEYGGDDPGPLSESRVLDIEDRLGGEYLAHDEWADGIAFVADEFDEMPWPWWVWGLGVVALALVIFVVVQIINALKRRAQRAAEMRTLEGQKKRAARALVHADEAVRTSEQELGFVTAEFGDETTAEFRTVLEQCRTRLRGGFDLLTKLEDSVEDTVEETRTWTTEVLRLCDENARVLDDHKQALASLRALAEDSEKTLTRLQTARADAAPLEQDARDHLVALNAAVPAEDLVGVVSNPDEIAQRLRDADVQLQKLAQAVTAHKPRAISTAVHEIERLLAEATELRAAIGAQADALAGRGSAASVSAETTSTASGLGEVPPPLSGPATLDQAEAAVRAAEASVQARTGRVGALALSRLNLARRQVTAARQAENPAKAQSLIDSAHGLAQQVQSLVSAPPASGTSRIVAREVDSERPLVYDTSPVRSRRDWTATTAADSDDGVGGRVALGGIGGGAIGLFSGLGIVDGESESGGVLVVCIIVGVVIGAISGAFGDGGGGGGSSSGWGGSSGSRRSSGGSRSRSSSRSNSSRSSSRSSSSRSSGRSGGRRF